MWLSCPCPSRQSREWNKATLFFSALGAVPLLWFRFPCFFSMDLKVFFRSNDPYGLCARLFEYAQPNLPPLWTSFNDGFFRAHCIDRNVGIFFFFSPMHKPFLLKKYVTFFGGAFSLSRRFWPSVFFLFTISGRILFAPLLGKVRRVFFFPRRTLPHLRGSSL